MKMHVISSGSKGNASIIYDDTTTILIDMGITLKRLKEGLHEVNKDINDIDYCLFTHEHSDHIKGINYLNKNLFFSRNGTIDLLEKHDIEVFHKYIFGDINVTPLLTSHDAISPCGFLFEKDNEKIAYLTDSGCIPDSTLEYMHNCDYYFIESNYDEDMLFGSSRPKFLKNRIASEFGHLSNKQSATYMTQLVGDKTKVIMLAHLSEECNTPSKAIETYKEVFNKQKVSLDHIKCICAKQWSSSDLC